MFHLESLLLVPKSVKRYRGRAAVGRRDLAGVSPAERIHPVPYPVLPHGPGIQREVLSCDVGHVWSP